MLSPCWIPIWPCYETKQDILQSTLALMVLRTLDVRGENNRRARFYRRLTREGRKQLQIETRDWEQTAAIVGRFFAVKTEDLS